MWRFKKFSYVSLEEAHQIIGEALLDKAKHEEIPVFHAYRRVLSEDVVSHVDVPPFNISHFDGYAVKAEDTSNASVNNPILLKVVGKSHLNEEYEGEIKSGETVYVSTGCKLPVGADAVIPVEQTRGEGEFIEIRRSVHPFDNVVAAGSDVKSGERIFSVGHSLRAQDIKLLADIEKWSVKVFRRPAVALIPVGSELTDRIEETAQKKIDSSAAMISILIEEAGGDALNLGIAPDDVAAIKLLLKNGLENADVVVTIGGASVGEKDLVWEAVNQLCKPETAIRGIKVQPGRVTSLSIVNGKPIVMLPGHIQSTLVGFYMLLLPIIQLFSGYSSTLKHLRLKAKLSKRLFVKEFAAFKRVRFVRVIQTSDGCYAEPVSGDSSLTSVIVKSDGFIVIPERKEVIEEGEEVDVHFLRGISQLN